MKMDKVKFNIKNEVYYNLYPQYIESFKTLYKRHNIHQNMLLYKVIKKQIPTIYRNIYKISVIYTTDKEIAENINITIIGLSESPLYGVEYIIEVKDINKNYVTLTNIAVSVIGKGNKIKWEKYYES